MKNLRIFACLLVVGGLSLYGWHLYMKAHWADYINVQPISFQIKEISSNGEFSTFTETYSDKLPKKYSSNIELLRSGDGYIWASNENRKLMLVVKREELISQGKPTGKYQEIYSYRDIDGTEIMTLRTSDYELLGCRDKIAHWSSGNLNFVQALGDGRILRTNAYVRVYHNPYQYLLCDYHYKLFPSLYMY